MVVVVLQEVQILHGTTLILQVYLTFGQPSSISLSTSSFTPCFGFATMHGKSGNCGWLQTMILANSSNISSIIMPALVSWDSTISFLKRDSDQDSGGIEFRSLSASSSVSRLFIRFLDEFTLCFDILSSLISLQWAIRGRRLLLSRRLRF